MTPRNPSPLFCKSILLVFFGAFALSGAGCAFEDLMCTSSTLIRPYSPLSPSEFNAKADSLRAYGRLMDMAQSSNSP